MTSLLVPARDLVDAERAERRRAVADYSRAEGTWAVYGRHWRRFTQFCEQNGVAPGPPTSAEALADWIVRLSERGAAGSTLTVVVAAIAHQNRLAGAPSPGDHPQVREVLAGARRLAARAGAGRGEADPLLPADLRKMVARLKPGLVGQRDLALLTFGLAGGFRRSEICRIELGHVRFFDRALIVRLPWSKRDQEGRGHERRICEGDHVELCPVRNVQAWLAAAGIREGYLFRPVYYGRTVGTKALSARRIDQIIREYTRAVVRDQPGALSGRRYSSHSLRSGLCTAAAIAGKPEHEIREHVGHRSPTSTARYIRAAGRHVSTLTKGIGL